MRHLKDMSSPFHAGEMELQRRAGVRDEAEAVGRIIGGTVPAGWARFLSRQSLAVASSVERGGRVWASLLAGPPGFIQRLDERTLRLAAAPAAGDPLSEALAQRPELGLLVIDPRTRQRLRFNGRGLRNEDGLFLRVDQAYGNCPKYIQQRALEAFERPVAAGVRVGKRLSSRQQHWVRRSDTFFIATFHPSAGADASHRGGRPGFVRVRADSVEFDDYPGNGMFNTLGNLLEHPHAGLLLVDFEEGHVLQLAGRARIDAGFTVCFAIDAVRETREASPLRYRLLEPSPANPPLSHPGAGGISTTGR
jgi:predicted pyridoxine 5'-phosphate oxidase superfamily flavin-nucleotide-binding protein